MILRIIRDATDSIEQDTGEYQITPSMLIMKGTHVFIASREWDEIQIELTDDIPLGSLKHLSSKAKSIKVVLPEAVNNHAMQLCTELYPDKAGTIRKRFMMKEDISELLC